jgi:hypothetical protein
LSEDLVFEGLVLEDLVLETWTGRARASWDGDDPTPQAAASGSA